MKRILAAAALMLAATPALADPIEGIWQTEADEGALAFVQVAPCGANFCGTIIRTFKNGEEYKSPNIGKQIIRDMAAEGGGKYEGKVWRPSNDKIYLGKITVSGKDMKMSGCVAGGLFCASQAWVKIQ